MTDGTDTLNFKIVLQLQDKDGKILRDLDSGPLDEKRGNEAFTEAFEAIHAQRRAASETAFRGALGNDRNEKRDRIR